MNGQSYLVSGGWDAMVKFWQINSMNGQIQLQQIGEAYVGKPVH